MAISISHGGDTIPKSPFHITVAPAMDLAKVKVEGLDTSKLYIYKKIHAFLYNHLQ